MKTLILGLLILFFTVSVKAQIEDCVGAIPVCGNSDLNLKPTGVGADDFAIAGNNAPDCAFTESKSLWLRIKIKQAGSLGFELIPVLNTGSEPDDYDFALYGPNRECGNLGNSIRCSSTNPRAAGVRGNTGMNETENENSEGPGTNGNGFVHWLDNVVVGDFYYLFLDNFNEREGFNLKWTGTAILEDEISKEDGGVDLGDDVFVCKGEFVELDATSVSAVSYLWNNGETTPKIQPEETGTYSVVVTTSSGCVSRDTVFVEVFEPSLITSTSFSIDQNCEPVELTLTSEGGEGEYEWFYPDGSQAGVGRTIVLSDVPASQQGDFKIVLTGEDGCQDEEFVSVGIDVAPTIEIPTIYNVCETDNVTMKAQSNGTSHSWSTDLGLEISNEKELTFTNVSVNDSRTFIFTSSLNGCETSVTVSLNVFPLVDVETTRNDIVACTNEDVLLSATVNQTNLIYEWTNPKGQIIGTTLDLALDSLTVSDFGFYKIKATNQAGCFDVDSAYVELNQAYSFDNFVERCPGDTFFIPQNNQAVNRTDSIVVELQTNEGCDSTYNYDINFLSCAENRCIGVPTSFAPNGNGVNEIFKPLFSPGCIPIAFELKIFNRWGNEVFVTTNPSLGWNGVVEQEAAQIGYYLWSMSYTFADNESETSQLSGGVSLIR